MDLAGERATYAAVLRGILEQAAAAVESFPAGTLDRRPHERASTGAELAAHIVGAVRAYAVGIGCDVDVSRDRTAEFATADVDAASLAGDLRALADQLDGALANVDSGLLDQLVFPEQSLFGAATPREVSRRQAIVGAIRHAGEHLGHLELTRDLLTP